MANEGRLIKYFVQTTSRIQEKTGSYASLPTAFGIAFDWKVTSQSLINNTSTIAWETKFVLVDASAFDFGSLASNPRTLDGAILNGMSDSKPQYASLYVNINGSELYHNSNGALRATTSNPTFASGSTTVTHNADGTMSLNFDIKFTVYTALDQKGESWYYTSYTRSSMSGTEVLEEIQKKAIIQSATDFTDEGNPSITYHVPQGTVDVQAGILWQDGTVAVPYRTISNTASSYTFPLTATERENLYTTVLNKGTTTAKVVFSIKSRSSYTNATFTEQLAGTKTLTIVNYMPTMDPEVWDFNPATVALTAGTNATRSYKIVKYFSDVAFDVHAEAKKGAGIYSIVVTNGERSTSNLNHVFDDVVSSLFSFSVTDTYGRHVDAETELSPSNWVEYTKLTCSASVSEMSADGDVAVTIAGKCFKGSFGAQTNTFNITYTLEEFRGDTTTTTLSNISPTVTGNDYTYTFIIPDLDYKSSYTLTVSIADKLTSATSASTVVAPEPIFDWSRTDFNFNVPVNINGEITAESIKINGYTVPTIVEQGTSGNWTYRKWSDGVAECWSILTLNTAITTAWGSMYVGATKMSKVNYPTNLFNAKPVETVTVQSPTNAVWVFAESGSTGVNSSTTTGIYNICRPNQITAASNYYLSFYVRGKWK